jgi:hypothetical protein
LPTVTPSSVKKIFANFCVKILFCGHYFRPLNTFLRKGKDPDPDLDMDPDLGGPKTCGSCRSGSRSGSPTLRMTPPNPPLNDENCQEDNTKKFRNLLTIILILQIKKAENRLILEKIQLKNYLLHHG